MKDHWPTVRAALDGHLLVPRQAQGVVVGLFVSFGMISSINRLSTVDIAFRMPPPLLGILVLGVVLGFLASLLPARGSTRLEVLDAINAV